MAAEIKHIACPKASATTIGTGVKKLLVSSDSSYDSKLVIAAVKPTAEPTTDFFTLTHDVPLSLNFDTAVNVHVWAVTADLKLQVIRE